MTPKEKEAHAFAIFEKQARAKAALPLKDREIHYFLEAYWNSLGNQFDADVHEKMAIDEAAKRFDVTVDVVKDAWEKVDSAGQYL